MHLSASIGTGKAPMDSAVLRIALSRQGHNLLPQMIEALHPFGQTARSKMLISISAIFSQLPWMGV